MGASGAVGQRLAYLILAPPPTSPEKDLLARVLSLTGASLPRDLVSLSSNTVSSGFGASRSLVALNEIILRDWDGDWRKPPPAGDVAQVHLADARRAIQRMYPRQGRIILQDPRLCFTGGVWAQALQLEGCAVQVVVAHSDPGRAAAALSQALDLDLPAAWALWLSYAEGSLGIARAHSFAVVALPDLLADPRGAMERLRAPEPACSWDGFERAAAAFLEPSRAGAGAQADPPPVGRREAELVGELDRLAAGEPTFVEPAPRTTPERVAWLLISGAPRSGTSLLRALVDSHPEVALLQEFGLTRFVKGLAAMVGRPPMIHAPWAPFAGEETALGQAATFYEAREAGGGAGSPGDLNALPFDQLAQGLFTALKPTRPRVIGDKTPMRGDWEDLDYLLARLPKLRFLVVLRNPRAVINSSMIRRGRQQLGGDVWPIASVQEAAEEWWLAWRRAGELAERLGPAVRFVKYETLCEDVDGAMAGVWDWLGLPPHIPPTLVQRLPSGVDALDQAEAATVDALLSEVAAAWEVEPDPLRLLAQFEDLPRPYVPGRRLPAGSAAADAVLVEGFSWGEPWGRWTDGERARIRLRHGLHDGAGLLELHVARAFAPEGGACDVVVRAEGVPAQLFTLGREASRMALLCPLRAGVLDVELLVLNPKSLLDPPDDERRLGVGLESVSLRVLA